MGLDMYLNRETYVSTYGDRPKGFRVTVPGVTQKLVNGITEQVAYWRKANQIHAWFVANVQDGEDDCGNYDVSIEQLTTLRDLCQRILDSSKLVDAMIVNGETREGGEWKKNMVQGKTMEKPALAQELLPATSGFFFGSTDYDEWYYRDLQETVDMLTPLIEHESPKGSWQSYSYHSSW